MVYDLLKPPIRTLFRPRIAALHGLEYVPAAGPFILAANHVDFLDPFFLTLAVDEKTDSRVRFLAKTNNYWWTGGAAIPIDPANRTSSVDRALACLAAGDIIGIFPEGTRNVENVMTEGKTGVARLALRSGAPVLPAGITGLGERAMIKSLYAAFGCGRGVTVRFGPPLHFPCVEDPIPEQCADVTNAVMRAIAPLCNKTFAAHDAPVLSPSIE